MSEPRAAARSGLALAVLALLALPAGCGQKGPLYLPKKTKTVITPAAPVSPAPTGSASDSAPASGRNRAESDR